MRFGCALVRFGVELGWIGLDECLLVDGCYFRYER